MTVTKTVNNATPNVGSNVIFTITATNNGPSTATGVSVTDSLPAGYTLVSTTRTAGTWAGSTWNIGNLANGASAILTITAKVNAAGSYGNTATITGAQVDPVMGNNSSTVTPVPIPQTDLVVTKTVNNPTPIMGNNVTFTITAKNNGPSDATGVSIADILPAGYTFVSATTTAGTSWTSPNWTIGNLANGATATLTITATVNTVGPYGNTAMISGLQVDPVSGNNSTTITPVPIPKTDLQIVKSVNNSTPDAGQVIVFTLTATNAGPSNATGVTVTDLLPSGYTFVSITPSAASYNSATGVWTIGNLANGTSISLNITVSVKGSGNYANNATINPNPTEHDPDLANNTATSLPIPVQVSDLKIIKTSNLPNPIVNGNVVFTLTATNSGPSPATNVVVNDVLPNGYQFVSSVTSAGLFNNPNWTLSNLAVDASETLKITAKVNASGTYINTASITGTEKDSNLANNSSSVTPIPPPVPVVNTDNATTIQGNPLDINILSNDIGDFNLASLTIINQPKGGTIQMGAFGVLTYLPNGNFFGNDQITYQICDNVTPVAQCVQGVVNIVVESLFLDPCDEAYQPKTFYTSFPEADLYTAFRNASSSSGAGCLQIL